jgi:hypothetical protein
MRIGNFKGDSEVKTKTVSIIKDRLISIYLESAINWSLILLIINCRVTEKLCSKSAQIDIIWSSLPT